MQELSLVAERRKQPFSTVFFGGGNPGVLSVGQMRSLLRMIGSTGKSGETTMEINPESLTEAHGSLVQDGLTRISIGIQSLSRQHLDILGRNVSREGNLRALGIARRLREQTGIQVNCDLMTCIPGQTVADALADIDELVDNIDADHISLYNLTVEEGTRLARQVGDGELAIPDEDAQEQILRSCWDHLREMGYEQYEISNFSKSKQTRCRHNERYWRLENYIGLGPAAAGTVATPGGEVRMTGADDLHAYLRSSAFGIYDMEELPMTTVMEELLLVGLRTACGIDKTGWRNRFGIGFDSMFAPAVRTLLHGGRELVCDEEDRLHLSAQGLMVCDAIIMRLAQEIKGPT